jgi:hypothetical protein
MEIEKSVPDFNEKKEEGFSEKIEEGRMIPEDEEKLNMIQIINEEKRDEEKPEEEKTNVEPENEEEAGSKEVKEETEIKDTKDDEVAEEKAQSGEKKVQQVFNRESDNFFYFFKLPLLLVSFAEGLEIRVSIEELKTLRSYLTEIHVILDLVY